MISYITRALIESESESLVSESIWTYYHMCNDQLNNNVPKEEDIWEANDSEWITTINTRSAEKNEDKYDKIDEYTSYEFNNVVERSFLCKNYHITEECVRMLATFAEMVFYNGNLGPLQKNRTGSMLAFHSAEAIKRISTKKELIKSSYLHFYISKTFLIDILEENQEFSKSVFDSLMEIAEYLLENNNFEYFDEDELGAVSRRMIVECSKITNVENYVKQILEFQKN